MNQNLIEGQTVIFTYDNHFHEYTITYIIYTANTKDEFMVDSTRQKMKNIMINMILMYPKVTII